MLIYIPGKPHPKGLLIRGICSKFEKSGCVFLIIGRHKHAGSTCPAGLTAVNLLNALEKRSPVNHVVLLDGAYPASMFLHPDGRPGSSRYICSVTKSAVSGIYNRLSEACASFIKVDQHCTLRNSDTGLLATLHNSAGKDIAIVTDATSLSSPPPRLDAQPRDRKPSFNLAVQFALLPVKSPSEILPFIGRTDITDAAVLESMPSLTRHLFGVDVLSPTNLDGKVTQNELDPLSIPHLTMIAEHLGLHKRATRPKLIKYILDNHPLAAEVRIEANRPSALAMRKRKAAPASMGRYDLQKLIEQNKALQNDLLSTGAEPEFHSIYRSNYGLHDRFNATLYTCFKFQRASGPFQMLAWLSIIIYTINARAMFAESISTNNQDTSPPCHTATFCLSIARQICNRYIGTSIYGDEKFVITDENLLQVVSEQGAAELAKKQSKLS
jgi:hypothetical protein